jgi:hypothetical protein
MLRSQDGSITDRENRRASMTERPNRALAGEAMSAMLESLSEQIRECYEHAEDCARKAAAQSDPGLKQDFLDMEKRWLALAKSFEFSQRLGDFSAEANRRAANLPKPTQAER